MAVVDRSSGAVEICEEQVAVDQTIHALVPDRLLQ
jgi:hypothetical protein